MIEGNTKYKERIIKTSYKMQVNKICKIKPNINDAVSERFTIDNELSKLRNRGRPYQPKNHFTREELNNIRDNELEKRKLLLLN